MRFLTANVYGINAREKSDYFTNMARSYDIVFFQETKLTTTAVRFLKLKVGNNFHVEASCAESARRGVVTIIKNSIIDKIVRTDICQRGQYLVLTVKIGGLKYALVNVYGDPDTDAQSLQTFTDLREALVEIKAIHDPIFLMAGDFNVVLEPRDASYPNSKPQTRAKLIDIISEINLFDVVGVLHPFPPRTYFQHGLGRVTARLDRVYASESLLIDASFKMLNRLYDHTPITLSFGGYKANKDWTFIDSFLKDSSYLQCLHNAIHIVLRRSTGQDANTKDLQHFIDYNRYSSVDIVTDLLRTVRKDSICYIQKVRKAAKQKVEDLFNALNRLRSELTNDPDNRQLREEHELIQNHVKLKMVERSAHRDQMNSNNHFTLSERVNSYFFRRAKKSQSTRTIQKLNISNPDGSIQTIEKENIPQFMRRVITIMKG